MAINMMCMNDKCKYYYEDNCIRNLNEERIDVDRNGRCETFEEGICDWYLIKTHELKILPEFFVAVLECRKTFELRKNDRDYKVGDVILLKEFDGKRYTGNYTRKNVTYVLNGGQYGLDKDYVILGIK